MTALRELKDTDLPKYRRSIAIKQKYLCGICGCSLGGVRTALDHCHSKGHLRGMLCSQCNQAEGRMRKSAQIRVQSTHLIRSDFIQWMKNLIDYLEHHDQHPSKVIHPTYDLKKGKQKPKKRTVKRTAKPKPTKRK